MMDKLISQQAAIDAVSEITTTMSVCTNKDECYGMKRMQKQAITELANLPSAQPEAISEWKKEFKEYVDSLDIARDDWKGIIEYIDELPSVQPQRMKGAWINRGRIIRCNKCKTGYATVKGMKSALTYNFCPNCGADMRGGQDE